MQIRLLAVIGCAISMPVLGKESESTQATHSYYEVEGEVTHDYFHENGEVEPRLSQRRQFRIRVRDDRWLLLLSGEGTLKAGFEYIEAGSDGRDCYQVLRFAEKLVVPNPANPRNPSPTNLVEIPVTNRANAAVAEIRSGPAPTDVASLIVPVWMAYASGPYYGAAHRDRVKPAWPLQDIEVAERDITFPALKRLSDERPHLPTWLAIFNEGIGRLPVDLGPKEFPLEPPFQNGYTNLIYEAALMTNVSGWHLPLAARVSTLCQRNGAVSSNDVYCCNLYTVTAHRMGVVTGQDFDLPKLPARTYVIDKRLETGLPPTPGVSYFTSKEGNWITNVADLKRTQAFAKALAESQKEKKEVRGRRFLALAAFAAPTLSIIWVTTSRKKRICAPERPD